MSTGGADFYYTANALGSVILTIDSAQAVAASYSYGPWGEAGSVTGSMAGSNPWQYAGGYHDVATGLTKFGARYYNPATGRFTQPDPSHQEANNYAYAGDDPINNTDPSGFWGWTDTFGAIGFGFAIGALAVTTFGIGDVALLSGIFTFASFDFGALAIGCALPTGGQQYNPCTG